MNGISTELVNGAPYSCIYLSDAIPLCWLLWTHTQAKQAGRPSQSIQNQFRVQLA